MTNLETQAKTGNVVEQDDKAQVEVKSVEPKSVKLERIKTGFKAGRFAARCN